MGAGQSHLEPFHLQRSQGVSCRLSVSRHFSLPLKPRVALRGSRTRWKVDQQTPCVAVVLLHCRNNRAIILTALFIGFLLYLYNQYIFIVMSLLVDDQIGQYQLFSFEPGEIQPLWVKPVTVIFDINLVVGEVSFQISRYSRRNRSFRNIRFQEKPILCKKLSDHSCHYLLDRSLLPSLYQNVSSQSLRLLAATLLLPKTTAKTKEAARSRLIFSATFLPRLIGRATPHDATF